MCIFVGYSNARVIWLRALMGKFRRHRDLVGCEMLTFGVS